MGTWKSQTKGRTVVARPHAMREYVKKAIAVVAACALALTVPTRGVSLGAGEAYADSSGLATYSDTVTIEGSSYSQTTDSVLEKTSDGNVMTISSYLSSPSYEEIEPTDIIFVLDQSSFVNGEKGEVRAEILSAVKKVVDNLSAPSDPEQTNRVALVGYGRINQSYSLKESYPLTYELDQAKYKTGNYPGKDLLTYTKDYGTGFYLSPSAFYNGLGIWENEDDPDSALHFCSPINGAWNQEKQGIFEAAGNKYETLCDSTNTDQVTIADGYKANMTYANAFMTPAEADDNYLTEFLTESGEIDLKKSYANMANWSAGASRLDVGLNLAEVLVDASKQESKDTGVDRNVIVCVVSGSNAIWNASGNNSSIRQDAVIAKAQEIKDVYGATIVAFGDYHKSDKNLNALSVQDTEDVFNATMLALCGTKDSTDEEKAGYYFSTADDKGVSDVLDSMVKKIEEIDAEVDDVGMTIALNENMDMTTVSGDGASLTTGKDWIAWLQKVVDQGGSATVTYSKLTSVAESLPLFTTMDISEKANALSSGTTITDGIATIPVKDLLVTNEDGEVTGLSYNAGVIPVAGFMLKTDGEKTANANKVTLVIREVPSDESTAEPEGNEEGEPEDEGNPDDETIGDEKTPLANTSGDPSATEADPDEDADDETDDEAIEEALAQTGDAQTATVMIALAWMIAGGLLLAGASRRTHHLK